MIYLTKMRKKYKIMKMISKEMILIQILRSTIESLELRQKRRDTSIKRRRKYQLLRRLCSQHQVFQRKRHARGY